MTAVLPGGRQWEYSAFPVHVSAKVQLSPRFVRVTLAGASLVHFAPWGLDQRIKLVLPMPDGRRPDIGLWDEPTPHPQQWYSRWKELPADERNVLRTYTPSAIRPERGEIDVDLFVHEPAGPASAWATSCAVGDELTITGPDVRVGKTGYGIHYVPPVAPGRVLLVGDESALPAIANIVAAVPDSVRADVLLELGDRADLTFTESRVNVAVEIIDRGPVAGVELERAADEWAAKAGREITHADDTYAWIAGEATSCARIRRSLTSGHGMAKDRVAFLGYWKLGGPLVS